MNHYQRNRKCDDTAANGLMAGQRCRIVAGPLAGLQGTAVDRRQPSRVLIVVDSKQRALFVEIGEPLLQFTDQSRDESRPEMPPLADTPPNVKSLAEHRLRESPYPALQNISCEYANLRLILQGRVPSFHMKQLAQNLVGTIKGIIVVNRLEVDE